MGAAGSQLLPSEHKGKRQARTVRAHSSEKWENQVLATPLELLLNFSVNLLKKILSIKLI